MLDYVIEKNDNMEFLPNKYIIPKESIYGKMDSLLLKYLDCSGKIPTNNLGSMKKYLRFLYLRKSLHSITHTETVKFKNLIH